MKRLVIGPKGLEFLRSFLQGGDDLAKAAAATMRDGDEVLTWLPDDINLADVSFLGWKYQEPPEEDMWEPLRNLMKQFLHRDANHIVVVESGLIKAGEGLPNWVAFDNPSDTVSYFSCDGGTGYIVEAGTRKEVPGLTSVFGFLHGRETSASQVSALIRSTFPFHEIHVLTSMPEGKVIESGTKIDREFLTVLGSRAEYISVGAYDGIGVVLWTREAGSHVGQNARDNSI